MAINQTQLLDLLAEYRRENWKGIQTAEWQQKIVRSMAEQQEPALLKRIAPYWNLPQNALILDLGSGVGNFVVACRDRGLRAFGVEPDRIGNGSSLTSLQIAGKRLNAGAFAAATGEQLPFRDSTFHLVVMDQVIEHVGDQERVLGEALRVLKPLGAIYIACPNYLRFYEPHYKVWFCPLMPKALGALYLQLRGRDPVLLKQITYTTNRRVRKLLGRLKTPTMIDLNQEALLAKCRQKEGSAGNRLGKLVRDLVNVPGLGNAVLWAAATYIRLREGGSEMLVFKEAQN